MLCDATCALAADQGWPTEDGHIPGVTGDRCPACVSAPHDLGAAYRAMDEAYTELLDDLSAEGRRARIILRNGKEDVERALAAPRPAPGDSPPRAV